MRLISRFIPIVLIFSLHASEYDAYFKNQYSYVRARINEDKERFVRQISDICNDQTIENAADKIIHALKGNYAALVALSECAPELDRASVPDRNELRQRFCAVFSYIMFHSRAVLVNYTDEYAPLQVLGRNTFMSDMSDTPHTASEPHFMGGQAIAAAVRLAGVQQTVKDLLLPKGKERCEYVTDEDPVKVRNSFEKNPFNFNDVETMCVEVIKTCCSEHVKSTQDGSIREFGRQVQAARRLSDIGRIPVLGTQYVELEPIIALTNALIDVVHDYVLWYGVAHLPAIQCLITSLVNESRIGLKGIDDTVKWKNGTFVVTKRKGVQIEKSNVDTMRLDSLGESSFKCNQIQPLANGGNQSEVDKNVSICVAAAYPSSMPGVLNAVIPTLVSNLKRPNPLMCWMQESVSAARNAINSDPPNALMEIQTTQPQLSGVLGDISRTVMSAIENELLSVKDFVPDGGESTEFVYRCE
ncbi:MAG: hypothetical protein LBR89_02170 [Holosporales bacterium]|nr:hypothetical protein [Holosporales bacterium]